MLRQLARVMALLFFIAFAISAVSAFSDQGASVMQRAQCLLAFVCSVVAIGIIIRDLCRPGEVRGINSGRI